MTRKHRVVWGSLAVVLAMLLVTGIGLANGQGKPGAQTAAAARGLAYTGGRSTGPRASNSRFTLEFVDADLVDVFQALATQSGVNIALSGSVKGKATLRLRNVTLEQAMNIVTKLNGLDYAWVDAAYVVGTADEVRAMRVSELRSAVVVLQHMSPEYAQQALSKLTPDVTVSTQKGQQSVLLLGTEASLAKAERALAEMDVKSPPSPPTTEVVPVRYVKADQLADMITAALPDVKVQPGPQENSLLVTANDQQWDSVRSMVTASDVAPAPSQETVAVYYIKYSDANELMSTLYELMGVDVGSDRNHPKVDLAKARAAGLTITPAPRTFTPTVQTATTGQTTSVLAAPQLTGGSGGGTTTTSVAGLTSEASPVTALILSGAPLAVERGMAMLERLDKAPRQIHIAAMVTEINRDDVNQLGIDWSSLGGTGVPFSIGEASADGTLPPPPSASSTSTTATTALPAQGLQVGKIVRTPLQWSAAITALESKHRARVLSNPSVTTLDGRQTSLHTGETIYFPALVSQNGTSSISGVSTVDAGVRLVVNPRINKDGEITLTISPSVSTAVLGTTGLPVVNERAVVTTVRVNSGETAVLAGLVSDTEDTTVNKVPFLGDIPLVGELFKSRTKLPAHTEILIFVTPTVIGS
ncbi:MAG: secretin N-terminal domain-containing protein [Armatimonadota bacterium]|jgi:general secretion pathway protein D